MFSVESIVTFLGDALVVAGLGVIALQWVYRRRKAMADPEEGDVGVWRGRFEDFVVVVFLSGFVFMVIPTVVGAFPLFGKGDRESVMFWKHLLGAAATLGVIFGLMRSVGFIEPISFFCRRRLARVFRWGEWHPLLFLIGAEAVVWLGGLVAEVVDIFLRQGWGVSLGLEEKQAMVLLIMRHRGDGWFMVSAALSVAVAAPVLEEVFFRGLLYPLFKRICGVFPAACLTGVIFGAAHFSAPAFLPLTFFGVYLCLVYEKTGDLRAPVLAHGFHNVTTFCLIMAGWG
ncbi:MAG: CPBP family intramembrane metalloprotease [Puniceicoccales bacterium]|jgi:membrane protease YdiL (CAAX protease family)|nr:CPBP family intramembrane metalloprotease [Puniceicoccales bacterium]